MVHEAVAIRREEGWLLNRKEEYTRFLLPKVGIDDQRKRIEEKKKLEEKKEEEKKLEEKREEERKQRLKYIQTRENRPPPKRRRIEQQKENKNEVEKTENRNVFLTK